MKGLRKSDGPRIARAAARAGGAAGRRPPAPRAGLVLVLLLLLTACGASSSPAPIDPDALEPVPMPDLSALEPQVRAQIEEAHARFEAARTSGAASPDQLAAPGGELALVLLAYDLPAAEPALRNAATLSGEEARWPYYLGHYYRLAGRSAEAESAYQRALELDGGDPVTRLRLAQARLESGDLEGAAEAARQAGRDAPEMAYAFYLRGQIAVEAGRAEEAVEHFERALALDPEADRLHYLLSQVYRQLGEIERAESELALRGDRGPRLNDPLATALDRTKQGANIDVRRGNALLAQGDLDAARQAFEAALSSDPGNVQARLNLGLVQFQLGQTSAALASAERAVELAPEDMEAWRAFAAIAAAAGETAVARDAFDRALGLAPRDARANEGMADLLRREGDCVAALSYYDVAIDADPAAALLHVRRAMCRLQAGDPAAAIEGLESAREILPEDRDVADALTRLLATSPADAGGDAARALELSEAARRGGGGIDVLETAAMAAAANGRFEEALRLQQEAIEQARAQGRQAWQSALERNLERYQQGQTVLDPWPDFIYRR